MRFWHERRLLNPLTWLLVAGTLPGVVAGAILRLELLSSSHAFTPLAAGVLLPLGLWLALGAQRASTRHSRGGPRVSLLVGGSHVPGMGIAPAEIERWATTDSGRTWRHHVVVPADGTENVRPMVPLGSHGGPMSLVWLRGTDGSDTAYRTAIAYFG